MSLFEFIDFDDCNPPLLEFDLNTIRSPFMHKSSIQTSISNVVSPHHSIIHKGSLSSMMNESSAQSQPHLSSSIAFNLINNHQQLLTINPTQLSQSNTNNRIIDQSKPFEYDTNNDNDDMLKLAETPLLYDSHDSDDDNGEINERFSSTEISPTLISATPMQISNSQIISPDEFKEIRDAVEISVQQDQLKQESLLQNTFLTHAQKKQLKNKISARNFRLRRKEFQSGLEQEIRKERQRNQVLQDRIQELEEMMKKSTFSQKLLLNENQMVVTIPPSLSLSHPDTDLSALIQTRKETLEKVIKDMIKRKPEPPKRRTIQSVSHIHHSFPVQYPYPYPNPNLQSHTLQTLPHQHHPHHPMFSNPYFYRPPLNQLPVVQMNPSSTISLQMNKEYDSQNHPNETIDRQLLIHIEKKNDAPREKSGKRCEADMKVDLTKPSESELLVKRQSMGSTTHCVSGASASGASGGGSSLVHSRIGVTAY